MSANTTENAAGIQGTVVCLPVRDLEKSLAFYRNVLGFADAQVEDGIIALELPNLSLFLMGVSEFEAYSKKAGRGAQFPNGSAGVILSCAMASKDALGTVLRNVPVHGGTVQGEPALDDLAGGLAGYFADPDGHLWEMVVPQSKL